MSVARWRKLGLVFCPAGERGWMHSHAAVPFAVPADGGLWKIFFSTRDHQGRSHTAYAVVDLQYPDRVLELSAEPVLAPGALGCFDDSGAMASWLVQHGDVEYLYYIGWNLGVTVPFRNAIGLATRTGDGEFERYAAGPILDRTMAEPHFCASCCVLPDGDRWRMWYLSCTGWEVRAGVPEHRYHIKYAESDDGIRWRRDGHVAIDYADDSEYAISRPCVIRDANGWKMWYSVRGKSYRIGYAESQDGVHWHRLDHLAGIDVSPVGWDSEMVEYPFVFDCAGQRYMLYNGNGYGRSGMGLAVWELAG